MLYAGIDYKDLDNIKNIKDFMKICTPIDANSSFILSPFVLARHKRYGFEGMLPFYLNPTRQRFHKDSRSKYLIVGVEGDLVMTYYKEIRMFKNHIVRLTALPVSLNDNKLNELWVFDKLYKNKLIGQVVFPDSDLPFIKRYNSNIEKVELQNYYSITDDRFDYVTTNRWKKDAKINKFINNPDVSFRKVADGDVSKLWDLYYMWSNYKKDTGVSLSGSKYMESMLTALEENPSDSDMSVYCIFYKEVALIFCVFINFVDSPYLCCDMECNLALTGYPEKVFAGMSDEDIDAIKYFSRYSSKALNYFFLQDFKERGILAYYNGGNGIAAGCLPTLGVHKKNFDDNCIIYHKITV